MPVLKFKIKQCLPIALETLNHYKTDPIINSFLNRFKMSLSGTKTKKKSAIEKAILTPKKGPTFRDLSEYIDKLKWFGKQHIFLFTLKGIYADYLEKLRDESFIKAQLPKGNLLNKNRLFWEETEPVLAGVTHSFNTIRERGQIIFKWVETREFEVLKMVPNIGQVMSIEKERAVNFFVIHLNDGTAELRIQSLQPRSIKPLKDFVDYYKNEINRFIHLDHFEPVAMEPVIRTFLRTEQLPIAGFQIRFAGKGKIFGRHLLPFYLKLSLLFRPFFSREISLYWIRKQKIGKSPHVFFTLNGENDGILFNSITDQVKVNKLLIRLKELSTELIKMDELKSLALIYPQHIRILSGIDFLFVGLKKMKINVKDVSIMGWMDQNLIKELFKTIAEQFPEKFSLEGTDFDVLVISNCFTLKGGAQECIKRKLDTFKNGENIKPFVATGLVGALFAVKWVLEKDIAKWIFEEMMNKILLPGIPLFVIKWVVLVIFAVLMFGNTFLFQKSPKALRNLLILIFQGLIGVGNQRGKIIAAIQKKFPRTQHLMNKLKPTFPILLSLIITPSLLFLFALSYKL